MNNEIKKEYLHKILVSQEFKDSKSYKILLEFLVNSTLDGRKLNESFIASEGLGKKGDFDTSSDISVSVYIHNLRKKLASYYITEGKTDELKLSISKGQHYKVTFNKQILLVTNRKMFTYLLIGFVTLILLNITLWNFYSTKYQNIKEVDSSDPIWQEFATGKFPILLVIGDYFFYKEKTENGNKYLRDVRVNSVKDFSELIKSDDKENKYLLTEITYLGKYALWCLNDILPVIIGWDKVYDIKLSSELSWQDLNKYNIIFIGSFKSLNIMENITNGLNSSYRISPNAIFFRDENSDSIFTYSAPKNIETGYLKDYTFVSKLPGPNSNTIIIFASTHDIGHISSVENFIDKIFLNNFEKKYIDTAKSPVYFESIFEVEGFERTGFKPILKQFKKVSKNYNFKR